MNPSSKDARKYIKEHGKLSESFKNRWLEALSSGKYKQAVGQLCLREVALVSPTDKIRIGYCCLGVVGHIQGIPNNKFEGYGFLKGDLLKIVKKNKKSIPKILQDQNLLTEYLAHLNDRSKSYKRVITFIEKYL